MGKEYWMERLKESLPKNEMVKPDADLCGKCTGLTVDRADEIVGYLYAGIGELEVASLELSKASSETKMERALRQIRFVSERMTCYLRDVVAECGIAKENENVISLLTMEFPYYEVKIQATSYGYIILCPFRLPSKNTYRVNEYWWKWIEGAVRRYRGDRYNGSMKKAMVAYVDIYPKEYPACRYTDADNQDIKKVTDCLKEAFLSADDSINLWVMQMGRTEEVDKPCSKIYLVDREKMAEWSASF